MELIASKRNVTLYLYSNFSGYNKRHISCLYEEETESGISYWGNQERNYCIAEDDQFGLENAGMKLEK